MADPFPSAILQRDVGLQVYLPPGVDSAAGRYPVLYVHDGQNIFDGASAFIPGQAWELDLTAERLILAGTIAPVIIVAIDHAGVARVDEFTPTHDAARHCGGGAARYARFLVEELKPFIDRCFPTEARAASTGLVGSSMGGLVTLAAGLQYPETFGALGLMSPSVWWDHRVILRAARACPLGPRPRIWLDVGRRELPRAVDDVRALRKALVRDGWAEPWGLRYDEDPGGDHSEVSWARRAAPMLRFLFPPRERQWRETPDRPAACSLQPVATWRIRLTTPAAGAPGLR